MPTCSESNCSNGGQLRRGWCDKHYRRWLNHGDPRVLLRTVVQQSPEERLRFYGWTEVEGPLDTPCWEFDGYRNSSGYGEIGLNYHRGLAHRMSYEHFIGPIQKGHIVRHDCDNPPCINPGHLRQGTHVDNVQDRVTRRRGRSSGEENRHAKLDWGKVREIRSSSLTTKELALVYRVTAGQIRKIRRNDSWKEEL